MPGTSTLRFTAGRFQFATDSLALSAKLKRDPHWTRAEAGLHETRSLRAASAFRRHGDEGAERLFQRAFQAHYDLPWLPPLPELDPHQRAGLEWVLRRKRSYLAHAPGAGKTAQAILAACLSRGSGQALFIVPPSLVLNWEREIWKVTEWLGVYPTIGIVPSSARRDQMAWRADFIVCPDSMLTKFWVYERLLKMRKRLVAVDEASRFKDPAAERSIAFYGGWTSERVYPGLFQRARHVVFLDGSPMPNRPMELWAPTYALHPEAIDCMEYDDFGYRYCGAKPNERGQWEYLYSSHEAELQQRLRRDFMHVVSEDELAHPERRRSLIFVNQDVRSAEHKSWERRHLGTVRLEEDASQGDLARFRRELGMRKVPFIVKHVRLRLEKNESILLFAWHRDVIHEISHALKDIRHDMVMGGTTAQMRELAFRDFQKGKSKLLLMNIAAGGRGHNLQRADRVIFGEFSWTDELNRQCEKRASRRGNDRAFTRCEYLVAPGSMDEVVLNSLFTKQKRVERIIG